MTQRGLDRLAMAKRGRWSHFERAMYEGLVRLLAKKRKKKWPKY